MNPPSGEHGEAPQWPDVLRRGRSAFLSSWQPLMGIAAITAIVMALGIYAYLLATGTELTTVAGLTSPESTTTGAAEETVQAVTYLLFHALGWTVLWTLATPVALAAAGLGGFDGSRPVPMWRTMALAGTLVALGELACGLGAALVLAVIGMVGFTSALRDPSPWRSAAKARDEFPVTIVVVALVGTLMGLAAAAAQVLISFALASLGPLGYALAQLTFLLVLVVFTYILCCWAIVFTSTQLARGATPDADGA